MTVSKQVLIALEQEHHVELLLPHLSSFRSTEFKFLINGAITKPKTKNLLNRFEAENLIIISDNKIVSRYTLEFQLNFAREIEIFLEQKIPQKDQVELVIFADSYVSKYFISLSLQGRLNSLVEIKIINAGSDASDNHNDHLSEIYLDTKSYFNQTCRKSTFQNQLMKNFTDEDRKGNKNYKPCNITFIIIDELGVIITEQILSMTEFTSEIQKGKVALRLFFPQILKTRKLESFSKKYIHSNNLYTNQRGHRTVVIGMPSDRMAFHTELALTHSDEVVRIRQNNFENTPSVKASYPVHFARLNAREIIFHTFHNIRQVSFASKSVENIFDIEKPKINKNYTSLGLALLHYERPVLLRRAIYSVLSQTRNPDEIIICDDGSTSPDAINLLNSLEDGKNEFKRKFKVFRNNNLYLGALRNTAAKNLSTELVFFLDDDNVLHPSALEKLEKAYKNSHAEIIGSYQSRFYDQTPNFEGETTFFSGVGIFSTAKKNWIADGNCMINRKFYIDIGGNSEMHSLGSDDHEFFTKVLVMGGRIEIVPERLIAAQQLSLRLRSSQLRQKSRALRVSYALSNERTIEHFGNGGIELKTTIDKVLYQKYIINNERIFAIVGRRTREFFSSISAKFPYKTKKLLLKNRLVIWLWNYLP